MLYPWEFKQLAFRYILYKGSPLRLNCGKGKDLIIEFD